jgi:CheY-like chemotaxis protein
MRSDTPYAVECLPTRWEDTGCGPVPNIGDHDQNAPMRLAPLCLVAAPAAKYVHSPTANPQSLIQILVLDDEEPIGELVGESLIFFGYSPTICSSPLDALSLLRRRRFDLIIFDFRMPEMTGGEFYEQAIKIDPSLTYRFIFLTGDVVTDTTMAFLESSGHIHLDKPFRLTELETAITFVLNEAAIQSTSTRRLNNYHAGPMDRPASMWTKDCHPCQ